MWRASGGKFDRERLAPLLERALNGRFVLVEASPERPSMLIKDVGSGLSKPAEYWLARSIGNRVEDQPDYDYGKWIANFYRQVVTQGRAQPRQRRRGHQLAAAVAPELPLSAAAGAVQRRGQLNHADGGVAGRSGHQSPRQTGLGSRRRLRAARRESM